MIESVFFDIDGTLVSFETHQVPESTKKAIRELRAKGVKVFVATGRMLSMLGVLDDIEFDGYITYNGGCCVDGQRREIFSHPVPVEQLEALSAHLKKDHFPVSYMCKEAMYVNELAPIVLDVANHVNISTYYLSKIFKKEMGVNFITYVTDRKMDLAKEMLVNTDIPVLNIALDLAYNEANYFSKAFKKKTGLTPSEYREKYKIRKEEENEAF